MTTETQIPEPSEVIQDYLDRGDMRWGRGRMVKRVPTGHGGRVECHCGAMILYDHLVEIGVVEEGPVRSDKGVEHTIQRLYALAVDEVARAMEMNDYLDTQDARKYARLMKQSGHDSHAPLFEFFQEIAPKYLGRVRDYYKGIGR